MGKTWGDLQEGDFLFRKGEYSTSFGVIHPEPVMFMRWLDTSKAKASVASCTEGASYRVTESDVYFTLKEALEALLKDLHQAQRNHTRQVAYIQKKIRGTEKLLAKASS